MTNNSFTPLEIMKQQLQAVAKKSAGSDYMVPALWIETGKELVDGLPPLKVNPGEFFIKHIDAIEANTVAGIDPLKSLNQQLPGGQGGSWINHESIYNLFVRLTTAYDHNGDGILGGSQADLTVNAHGIRESGTFLKAIAMLGYIKALGCTTIHLLPVTAIGRDGNKGALGSPYAIKNPYRLEETQADPLIAMGVEDQFRAFIQACHALGIRVIAEFVFRTASKDSDWIAENPDWFYWIDEQVRDRTPGEKDLTRAAKEYGNPIFAAAELQVINQKINAGDLNNLPAPPAEYRHFFKLPPDKEAIKLNEHGQYRGEGTDVLTGNKVKVRIPGAFADWPPDDNQPPWGDVTYLRMYRDELPEKPEFNYIAYNTIRMYDERLARLELANRELWQAIIDLIPTYQQKYGIDGVMVDMGHAVPVTLMQQLISKARKVDPNFAFLSENFEINQESVDAGYNAVVGYAWWVEYQRDGMYNLLNHIGNQGVPLPFFGAVENHNTPRAAGRDGGEKYSRYAFLVNSMLPKVIPFIHSGQEIGETMPVNTGLDFSNADLKKLADQPLALFDLCGYHWNGSHPMLFFVRKVLQLRLEFAEAVLATESDSFCMVQTGQADVIAFVRRGQGRHVLVMFNRDLENSLTGSLSLEWCLSGDCHSLENLLADSDDQVAYPIEQQKMPYMLASGESRLFAW